MYKAALVLCLLALLDTSDCDSDKQNQRIKSLESDVNQLKTEVAELKQKRAEPEHHYELRNEGFRTFRFDPATGDTCIKLTTTDDWKRKETKAQSCECIDETEHWFAMPLDTEAQKTSRQNYYDYVVKESCGI